MDLKRFIPRTKTQKWGVGIFVFSLFVFSSYFDSSMNRAVLYQGLALILFLAGVGLFLWLSKPESGYLTSLTKTKKWGLGIFLFSLMGILVGITGGTFDYFLLVGVPYIFLAAIGLYLWRSSVPSDYFAKRAVLKQNRAEGAIQAALEGLEGLSGARAVVAYESLQALVVKNYKTGAEQKFNQLLDSVNFDRSRVESKFLGALRNLSAGAFATGSNAQIRVFKDWVIAGKIGYDFDVSTRGDVTVDGAISFDNKNNPVDTRTAALHLATQEWAHSFPILPAEADEARRILNQLNAIIERMKPKAVSAADITEAMERLMRASGKSPAEKLEELSNLRYQRLLSDAEFELAKTKILGI